MTPFTPFFRSKPSPIAIVLLFTCILFAAMLSSVQSGVKATDIDRLTESMGRSDLTTVNQIIESHINLNDRDRNGSTPLVEAIALHFPSLVEKLLLFEADPNFTASDGTSPLIQADFYCDVRSAKSLLDHVASTKLVDRDGETAFINAASNCSGGVIVRLLLDQGASVNARSKDGATALTCAAFSGNEKALNHLLDAGADVRAKTKEGETALSIACGREIGRNRGHDRICELLKNMQRR